MLISRTAEDTDEDGILKILQHSGRSCGQPEKSIAIKMFFVTRRERLHVLKNRI
jgi:hypothetical protein